MPRETKAQREKREADELAAKTAAEAPPEPDAITIVRQETPEGGVVWALAQVLGNVKVDQVSTGLRLAAKRVDEELLGS